MTRIGTLCLLLLVPILACAPDDPGPSAEQLQERDLAARQACAAEILTQRAEEQLLTLQEFAAGSGPLGFQQAYAQHANLRLVAFARQDSALNHARTPEDSIRHAEAARSFQIRAPEPESVEENVIRSYETNLVAILSDADHPCNWKSELEERD